MYLHMGLLFLRRITISITSKMSGEIKMDKYRKIFKWIFGDEDFESEEIAKAKLYMLVSFFRYV